MLLNKRFKSKEDSFIRVGVGRPEFTPLERAIAFDEGGSPQVGGGRTRGPGPKTEKPTSGRGSRGDIWGLLARKRPPNQVGRSNKWTRIEVKHNRPLKTLF